MTELDARVHELVQGLVEEASSWVPKLALLVAEAERLEAENARLRAEIAALRGPHER